MHSIRFAEPGDVAAIHHVIEVLADYEHALDQVVATPEMLAEWMFQRKVCECLVALVDDEVVGIALFFHNYSTWLGRGGIYLEDLCVLPEHRGKGIGKALLKRLAAVAVERECGRFEWSCLDWNEPSIQFYKAMGAKPMDGWTVYRVEGQALKDLAQP